MKDFTESLKLIGDRYSNYFLSLNLKDKYTFKKIWCFNDESGNFLINKINLIKDDSLLSFSVLFQDWCKINFDFNLIYSCTNPSCSYSSEILKTNKYLKSCPKCKSGLELQNNYKLNNVIRFYLDDYKIYLLGEEQETKYLIYDNLSKNYDIKKGNANLKDYLYLKLKGHNINLNYLKYKYGDKDEKNLISLYINDNNLISCIDNINFKPVLDNLFFQENRLYYNDYKGNKYLNMKLTETEQTDLESFELNTICPAIYELINNLVAGDKDGFKYIINYLSFVLNNPSRRTEKVLSFFGEEATGKGIFYHEILAKLFAGYCNIISMDDLIDNTYNDVYENTLFVFVDESYYNKSIEQLMLNYTTAKQIMINHKYGNKKLKHIYFNIICASNKDIPMKVGNRRSVYFRSRTLGGSITKSVVVGEKLALQIPKELNDFAKYLKSLKVDYSYINKGYDNIDKKDILQSTTTIEERFLEEMLSYRTFLDFVKEIYNKPTYDEVIALLHENTKDNFIEFNFFLDLYNRYRLAKGLNIKVQLNRFNWFCVKLNISKTNINQFKRGYNDNQKKVRWINLNLIQKLYNK